MTTSNARKIFASLLACLMLSSAACSMVPVAQSSHPVEVTHYVELDPPAWAVKHVDACALPAAATWYDVWKAGLCKDASITLANCRADRLAKRASADCLALLQPDTPP